jgi:cellulase
VRANDALNESPTGAVLVPTFTAAASSAGAGGGTATSSAGGGSASAVPEYGQCGGEGYTGSTVCVAGTTCTVSSEYYSQCL